MSHDEVKREKAESESGVADTRFCVMKSSLQDKCDIFHVNSYEGFVGWCDEILDRITPLKSCGVIWQLVFSCYSGKQLTFEVIFRKDMSSFPTIKQCH